MCKQITMKTEKEVVDAQAEFERKFAEFDVLPQGAEKDAKAKDPKAKADKQMVLAEFLEALVRATAVQSFSAPWRRRRRWAEAAAK